MKTTLSFCSFILFSLLLFSFFPSYGQSPNCYRITFSDKNDSPYSVNRPEEFLSLRAIAKRERFNIPVIEQDLPVNPHYIDSILNFSREPSQFISKSKWDNSVVIFYPETEDCHAIIDAMLNHFSFVIDTLPVAYYKLPFLPPDTPSILQSLNPSIHQSFNVPYSCDYDYGNSIDHFALHYGQLLHKAGFCGNDMLICVFDVSWDGFDTISYFKPLYENGQIWGIRDLIPGENNIYTGHVHGTAVTSEMASTIEGKLIGTAPQANYFFIRSDYPWDEQLVEEDFWAQAAEIADSLGADVVNSSVGYVYFDFKWQNIYTPADNNGMASIASRAASILAQKGVVVVQGLGNDGLTDWRSMARPADAFYILAIGNVNKYGKISPTSSYGPSADGRIKPDVASVGWKNWCVESSGNIMQNVGYGGCSAAAPMIAGLSACLWQALPQYSSLEIMDLIRKYGDRYNNPNDRTGYGIPNFYQCYLDQTYGVMENVKPEILVYPNPTNGQLTIDNEQLTINNVEVFDVYGKKLSSNHLIVSSSNHLINIAHLQAGIYFVKIFTEAGIITKKVIKY